MQKGKGYEKKQCENIHKWLEMQKGGEEIEKNSEDSQNYNEFWTGGEIKSHTENIPSFISKVQNWALQFQNFIIITLFRSIGYFHGHVGVVGGAFIFERIILAATKLYRT